MTFNEPIPSNALPGLTVDNLIFGYHEEKLQVFINKAAIGHGSGKWGLPGGWIKSTESLEEAANRILQERTGISQVYLQQLRTFSKVKRYPHGRIITTVYFSLVRPEDYHLALAATELDAKWCDLKKLPKLIYDHSDIVCVGIHELKHKVRHEPIGFNLLPPKFTLFELQKLYEAILDIKFDNPNFRRKMLKMDLLVPCNEKQEGVPYRAAKLYKFDRLVYNKLTKTGFVFEL